MPYHRLPRAFLHEDLKQIEREGEVIVAVTQDDAVFHVFTKWAGDTTETREWTTRVRTSNGFGGDAA